MPRIKFFAYKKWIISFVAFIVTSLAFFFLANMLHAQGVDSPANQTPLCQQFNFNDIERKDRPTLDSLIAETKTPIIPDGETLEFRISQPSKKGTIFCGAIGQKKIDIITAENSSESTVLTLRTPHVEWNKPYETTRLELVSIPFDEVTGQHQVGLPNYFIIQDVKISSWWFSFIVSILLVIIIYLAAAIPVHHLKVARNKSIYNHQGVDPANPVIRQSSNKAYEFFLRMIKYLDPVAFTAEEYGKASIPNLQITWFTLVVFGLLIHVLLRTGQLCDISKDILLLLGISGTSKILLMGINATSNRLSLDNLAWLRAQGWLKDSNHQDKLNWEDLINTNGGFDVYKFQLLLFSFIIGITLTVSGLGVLTEFRLPQGFIELLGLANVVYILGNTVSRNSLAELNIQISELRSLEKNYSSNPSEYIIKARDVAGILVLAYGKEYTRFDPEITKQLLEPKPLN
jgi:hypothetical protein